jgi:hypothetical protein
MDSQVPKTPKHRSPSYPAIDLQKALERTQQLVAVAGRHAVPLSAALSAWGYSEKSSGGQLTAAAIKKFGLAADEGQHGARQLQLTQLGQELVFYDSDRDSAMWTQRAQEAALKPTIHQELWTKYDGQLPDDSVIRPYLVLERGFSDGAAKEVLRVLRSSVIFAKMNPGSSAGSMSPDKQDVEQNEIVTPAIISGSKVESKPPLPPSQTPGALTPPHKREQRTVQVPYSPGEWALVQASFPISVAAWDQMIAVLEVMKPGLVDAEASSVSSEREPLS